MGGVRVNRGQEMLADLRATTSLTLPDCCVLDTALSNAATLATFDTTLARAANQLNVTAFP